MNGSIQIQLGRCLKMARVPRDLTNKQFYDIYPQEVVGIKPNGDRVWKCLCKCGNNNCEKELEVRERYLLNNKKKSCNKGRHNNRLFTPTIGVDKYVPPKRLFCTTCNKNTPHKNGVCSWHVKEIQ
jgi:hypothetical protein